MRRQLRNFSRNRPEDKLLANLKARRDPAELRVRGVHLADWRCVGNGPAGGGEGLRARSKRQRSHVRIVSGALEKHVPGVPGLWRVDFLGWMAREMVHSSTGFRCIGLGIADKPGDSRPRRGSKTAR